MFPVSPVTWDLDLLDRVLRREGPAVRAWEAREVCVVLGRSNRAGREARLEACARDGVPVYRRRGGGGAVVLAPGCLVVSVARPLADPVCAGRGLEAAVRVLARALAETTGMHLEVRGTGDLCVGDRKVGGSTVYARRGGFLYQASVLVSMDLGLVDRYLRHPSREPPYRRGRPHRTFLTTLAAEGGPADPGPLGKALERTLLDRWEEVG